MDKSCVGAGKTINLSQGWKEVSKFIGGNKKHISETEEWSRSIGL
jgi:hypothetical protein